MTSFAQAFREGVAQAESSITANTEIERTIGEFCADVTSALPPEAQLEYPERLVVNGKTDLLQGVVWVSRRDGKAGREPNAIYGVEILRYKRSIAGFPVQLMWFDDVANTVVNEQQLRTTLLVRMRSASVAMRIRGAALDVQRRVAEEAQAGFGSQPPRS